MIDPSVHIPDGVSLGSDCRIGRDVLLRPALAIADNVSIGPRVVFVDDRHLQTVVQQDVQIAASAVIGAGVEIGRGACIKPGAVVVSNVPPNAIVEGNPARISGYVRSADFVQDPSSAVLVSGNDETTGIQRLGVGDATLHRMRRVVDIRGALSRFSPGSDLIFELLAL